MDTSSFVALIESLSYSQRNLCSYIEFYAKTEEFDNYTINRNWNLLDNTLVDEMYLVLPFSKISV